MKLFKLQNWFLILFLSSLITSCKFREKASLIVYKATIYTVDNQFSTAQAMAIRDGKIIAIGTNDDILKKYEADELLNADSAAIFPGFIDAHAHFVGFAKDRWKCTVTGTESFDDIIDSLIVYSKSAPMEWIYGRGWDQNDWKIKEFPDKSKLDSLFPDRPVYLKRVDGHAAIANQKALDLAGININTKVAGGEVEIKNGKLTGILVDNAMNAVEAIIPDIDDNLSKKYFVELQKECLALGVTSVHDAGISEHEVNLLDESQKSGELKMKFFVMLTDSAQYYDRWIKKGRYKTDRLQVGGFKLYADGALGSRGACLIHDYSDKPGWKGFLLSDSIHFAEVANKLINSDFQMCTHAIGDSGNRALLNIYANVLKGKNDRRWRIEHAQIVDSNDFDLFGKFNIVPSVQPTHATSDMYWAENRIGPIRIKNAYAYKHLLGENNWLPLGTDFPVEDINPFKTFLAAVFRVDAKGYPNGGFEYDNALSRQETIRGMTIWAAKAAFEEKNKGSLEVGKSADFVILNQDLMKVKQEDVLKTKVKSTWINGEKVYSSQ